MFSSMSLKSKILLLCTLMSLFTAAVGYYAYKGLADVESSSDRIVDDVVPNQSLVNSMALNYRRVRIELRTLGIEGVSKTDAEQAIRSTHEAILAYEEESKELGKRNLSVEERKIFMELEEDWKSFKSVGERALALFSTGKTEDKEAMIRLFFVDCPKAAAEYNLKLNKMINYHKNKLNTFTAESKAIAHATNKTIAFISIFGILGSLIISYVLANNAAKLSKSINEIAYSLKTSADEVSSAATQIANASEELSQATTEQAASLQETSSSIEEINSMISANTSSAKQSALESERSLKNAEKGKAVVQNMIKAIDQISMSNDQIMGQIDESNKEIEDIVKLIGEIGNKTKVINDIVFQTKLLSFNASVEAARAGENGKGFAVVAQEVGNLAAMSGNAAVEISSMLDNSIKRVETIVKNSKEKVNRLVVESKQSVDQGTRVANDCGDVLEEIVKSVATVSNSVTEISNASQEQAQGVSEVTKAIAQLDQVTQENTSTAAESANASALLSEQALTLTRLVGSLVETVEGKKSNQHDQTIAMSSANVSTLTKITKKTKSKIEKLEREFPSSDDSRFSDV